MESLYDGLPKDGPVRVLGKIENLGTRTQRIDWLQRQAMLMLGRPIYPKGVFKFKTYEEADAWMKQIRRSRTPSASHINVTSSNSAVN